MKKILAIMISIALAFNLMTACSGSTVKTKSEDVKVEGKKGADSKIKVGTRQNPVPFNTTVLFDGMNTMFDKYKAEITLIEIIRGDEALQMAKKANQFNDEPEEGKEYLFAKFRINALDSEDDKKIDINNVSFEIISQDGVAYEDFTSVSGIKPQLTEMYKGAQQEGYATFMVDKADKNPMIVFLERNNSGIWFSTDKDMPVNPDAEVYTPSETNKNTDGDKKQGSVGTRQNPVPFNTAVLFDGMKTMFDKFKVEITLTQIIRGDEAWQMAKKANQFNDEPDEGKEYLFAKFRINALDSEEDKKIDINNSSFEIISQDGVAYEDFVSVSGVKPQLTEMYKGAQQEGYATFMVDIADKNPMLVFLERNNSGIWFSTK